MQGSTQAEDRTVELETLKTITAAQADEHGRLPEDARIEIEVAYDPKNGTSDTKVRTGTVWACDDNAYGTKLRFSDISGADEDPYFIRDGTLVSVGGRRNTDLGLIKGISIKD
jgi:hypothetical protein